MRNEDTIQGTVLGQAFRISGRESVYLLITAGALIAVGYMLWDNTRNVRKDLSDQTGILTDQHKTFTDEHQSLKHSMDNLNETMQEQVYISSLSQERRERLNLTMPRSLREKVEQHR